MAKIRLLIATAVFGLLLAACQKEGPAEKAGKEIDQAGRDASQALDQAADSAREATKSK